MDDQEFQPQDSEDAAGAGFDHPGSKLDDARARHLTVAALLGLLAGDGDVPREGQRDIIASAIRRALDTSSTSEFPNLARLIGTEGLGELDQRAARCRSRDMHVRGQYQDVPVLALSAEIHRNDFINADGKEARCKLFLALVDLAISCPKLLESNSFKSAVAGLRVLLERLAALPKGSVATRHFSVWQLFDWVERNVDFADYVKRAIRVLRPNFLLAWRAFSSVEDYVVDDEQVEGAVHQEENPNEAFWLLPESTRYECDLPPNLKKKLLATELTRITALSRYASASLLVRTDEEMKSVVASLLVVAKAGAAGAPHALAQLLSISTGISVDHAYQIKYADPASLASVPAYPGIITLDGGWLIRSEFDPRPKPRAGFEPRTVHVPIPEPLAALLRTQTSGILAGEHAIHVPIGVVRPKSPRVQSGWFTTLASRLMRDGRYGVSLAQHVLCTSLGLDTAPVYYDRMPASYIAHAIARVTHPWFGSAPRPRASAMPSHSIGSQRVIELEDCKRFFGGLRTAWSDQFPLCKRIHLRSRNLRNGLLLVVCSRTNTSIERITLADVSPNSRIMMVFDKAVALDHTSRLAALPTKLIRELEDYLAELHEAIRTYPNTPLAIHAAGVIAGEMPLFLHVESAENCRPITLKDHFADFPTSANDIENWLRQLGNACLTDLLPESLRAVQMGWHGTRAGAISELSTQSAIESMEQISKALGELLKRCGWAPLPKSNLDPCPSLLPAVNWEQAYNGHQRAFEVGLKKLEATAKDARQEFASEVIPGINAFFRANGVALEATTDGLMRHEAATTVSVSREMHAAMLRVMTSDSRSEMLSRELIHEWIKNARREKLIAGPVPKYVARVHPSQPGPFVRQAHRSLDHRAAVLEVARRSSMSAAARTFLVVLLEGWTPDVGAILGLMKPGASLHDLAGSGVLLVEAAHVPLEGGIDSPVGCLAFDGAAALALRAWHRGAGATTPNVAALKSEIHSVLSPVVNPGVDEQSILEELEALMRAYLALQVPGVMRDVATRRVVPAFAPISRVVALHENHPIWPAHVQEISTSFIANGVRKSRKGKFERNYTQVKKIITQLVDRWTLGADEALRNEAIIALRLLVPEGIPRTGAHVVALYAAAYLTEGLNKKNVRPITVQDAVYSVGEALIAALPEQVELSRREVWQAAYARALDACREQDRPRLARDLNHFQKVMSREYDLPLVGLDPLLSAFQVPSPPEPVGFLTGAEQAATISIARMRMDFCAVNGSPTEQEAALGVLAITAVVLSTSMRDREIRVPQINAWRDGKGTSPRIDLRSNGQDFVKSEAGRRAIRLSGSFAALAIESTERLVRLKTAVRGDDSNQKLFAPPSWRMEGVGVPSMMRQINADIRQVTDVSQAAVDASRKTWALAAFRGLGRGASSLWPAREMLAEMGQASISTMLGYYLHDPVVFIERLGGKNEVQASYAAWILGMVPRSATRLLNQGRSWIRPVDAWVMPVTSTTFEFLLGYSTRTFSPCLPDIEALISLIANEQSVASAMGVLGWPTSLIGVVEKAMDCLRGKGVMVGRAPATGMYELMPPTRAHANEALDACRKDAHCWKGMAWIFDQWLIDWRMWDRKGVTAKPADWEEQVGASSPIHRLPWQASPDGHMNFYELRGGRKHAHSAWNALLWSALSAWLLQRIRNQ